MTTFGWIITLIGIATLSGQFMRLVERFLKRKPLKTI